MTDMPPTSAQLGLPERLALLCARQSGAPMPQAPAPNILHTERLRLRPADASDVAAVHAHWSRHEVGGCLFGANEVMRKRVAQLVRAGQDAAQRRQGGLWLVSRADDDAFMGTAALLRLSETTPLELFGTLDPEVWGHGYATEAGQRLLRFAFEELRSSVVLADMNGPDPRTPPLAQRLGMRTERRALWPGLQVYFVDRKTRGLSATTVGPSSPLSKPRLGWQDRSGSFPS